VYDNFLLKQMIMIMIYAPGRTV